MNARLQLPFSLPVHLKVTQFRGDSPTHRTGLAIDLAPILSATTKEGQVEQYVTTYRQLFAHLRFGLIRINNSQTCWHYHLVADSSKYVSGYEQYARGTKIINGRPETACIQYGPVYEIDHKKDGATLKFAIMLGKVQDSLAGNIPFVDVFTPSFWSVMYQKITEQYLDPTYIYFDTKMISQGELINILSCFSADFTQTFMQSLSSQTPDDRDKEKNKWLFLLGGGAALALYLSSRRKND